VGSPNILLQNHFSRQKEWWWLQTACQRFCACPSKRRFRNDIDPKVCFPPVRRHQPTWNHTYSLPQSPISTWSNKAGDERCDMSSLYLGRVRTVRSSGPNQREEIQKENDHDGNKRHVTFFEIFNGKFVERVWFHDVWAEGSQMIAQATCLQRRGLKTNLKEPSKNE
jgi:hypothetical protein